MEADQHAATNGHAPFPAPPSSSSAELIELRAAHRRQAHVIDTLTCAITRLRTGATALKADNTDLRGENHRLRAAHEHSGADATELAEIHLRIDERAPATARAVLAGTLHDQVPALVLEQAQLLASEIVANSVLHCGATPDDTLVFRVELSSRVVRVEVEDPGQGATIAPRPPDLERGGSFGLNLIKTLSESWGITRSSTGTRVWAQVALTTGVPGPPEPNSPPGRHRH
jgi:anti-sigma regulatory factor (Ser/Thr protein kinase)